MSLHWDDELWILQTEQPTFGCAPAYISNGRIGLRLGALMLGTDLTAPPLTSADREECMIGGMPRYDHSYPLQTFASFAKDDLMLCLPSWANINLTLAGQRFQPTELNTSSTHPLRSWLDMRNAEAGMDGVWNLRQGPVKVKIRLLIPRGRITNAAMWELELDGIKDSAELEFGLIGAHCQREIDLKFAMEQRDLRAHLRTKKSGRDIGMGLRWECAGEVTESVHLNDSGNAIVKLVAKGPKLRIRVFCSIRGGTEPYRPSDVTSDLDQIQQSAADGSVWEDNRRAWRDIWSKGLDVTTLPIDRRDQQMLLAQQFYLIASFDGSATHVAVLGLSGNQWGGRMFWDSDLWHFRALNALWPDLARQIVKARLKMLPEARRHAKELNLAGAWYGWMCDEMGVERAPHHYQTEIHVNAWIALAAYESAKRANDPAWTREIYPILSGIADAVCMRAVRDDSGAWHLLKVLPPDESVTENPLNPGTCDDSVSTNLAFSTALRAAIETAATLGETPSPKWAEVAEKLVILPPNSEGIIPEYRGYNGHHIKQADAILAFYPLNYDQPDEIVRANVDYYREKVINGPLMTEQVDACIRLQRNLGDREAVLRDVIKRYRRYVRGPFEVVYECVDNSNSLMLTACGGILATLIYGWFRVKDLADCDSPMLPRIGG